MAPPCEFQICLLIGQENLYLHREIAKALPIGQDVPPCTLHSSFFEGVKKRFPLKRQPKNEFFSDIFRYFYNIHIRLWFESENIGKLFDSSIPKSKMFLKNMICN